jgi:PAS domain S-box-containing protein
VTGAERSLLSFVDTPILVGDPQGCAAYVNPAFEECFQVSREDVLGRSLAEIFEGGGREAVLRAVAEVCKLGESVRFRMRERGVGFAAAASPIQAGDENVGVVILLKEEVEGVERLIALHREIQDPLDELGGTLENLLEQVGGPRAERQRSLVEDGLQALARLRKWSEHVNAVLCGAPTPSTSGEQTDPAALLRSVARRVEGDVRARGAQLEVVTAYSLPRIHADAAQLEAILVRLVRDRLEADPAPTRLLLSARLQGADDTQAAILSLVERFPGEAGEAFSPPALAKEVLASCGGTIRVTAVPAVGRATVIRLAF